MRVLASGEQNFISGMSELKLLLVTQIEERVALDRVQHVDAARCKLNAQAWVRRPASTVEFK